MNDSHLAVTPMRDLLQHARGAFIGSLALAAGLALATSAAAKAPAEGARFDGFRAHFNLGQAANGAVCDATRSFDGPVIDDGGRAWTVKCRGWSTSLGTLYVFPGGGGRNAEATWRTVLAGRTDCLPEQGQVSTVAGVARRVACKTKVAGLNYVVLTGSHDGAVIAAEGRAPIEDVLVEGVRYLSGAIPEPAPLDTEASAVSNVSTAGVGELSSSDTLERPSVESLREAAYTAGQDWRFDQAQLDFGQLSVANDSAGASSIQAEALYNQAFNASNTGRSDQAEIFFEQGDRLAGQADFTLRGLALNYRAADARNQQDYEGAVRLADAAIAARVEASSAHGAHLENGALVIPEVGSTDGTQKISFADRERLRDVQALEIKATSLQVLGRADDARGALAAARAILDRRLEMSQPTRRPVLLGQAAPWLNTRVWADLLRLDRGTPAAAATEAAYRDAVAYFGVKHPGSLPLAAFFLEQAGDEAALSKIDATQEAKAIADYQSAFRIFIDQRGSLADSADLARPYFDFLLHRIGGAPAAHPDDVKSFFTAAQALIAQSSAEAAKRQAANAQSGDDRTAALARALQDTDQRLQANDGALRRLNEQGVYQGPQIAALQAERSRLAGENAKLQGELLEVDPGYTTALHTLVDLAQLQKALKPGEIYVKAFLLADSGYGVLVSPEGAIPYRIDLTRDAAADMVRRLRYPIDNPGHAKNGKTTHGVFNVALASTFFQDVFGPVRDDVMAAKHIIYEPDATLISVPISAYVTDTASADLIKAKLASPKPVDYVGVAWLGLHSYNSIAMSASAFYQARIAKASKASHPFFGYGDPTIPPDPADFSSVRPVGRSTPADEELCGRYRYSLTLMHPLPDTRREVADVAQALDASANGANYQFGDAFTDTAVLKRGDLSEYRVVYFATHGLLDEGNPCLHTALLTSFGGEGSDALLDLPKISSLHLDADMVVLSACNTGSNAHGKAQKEGDPSGDKPGANSVSAGGGEALGGLVTSFVQAGARNVVVSNWEVDSVTTAKLMITLFQQKQVSQAEALANAERVLMNEPRHSHPYYWAPFTVVGDGARPLPGA